MSVRMKQPSKPMLIALIAVILVFVVIVICLPDQAEEDSAENLIVAVDTDIFIGSVGVSYARWDGSSVSGGAVNADGSPIAKGDSLRFTVEGWPAIVSVYADPQGMVLLASGIVEEAPPEGCIWQASVLKRDGSVIIQIVPVEN